MKRLCVSLIVLTAMGGCLGLDRNDTVEDNPYGSPRRSSAQAQFSSPPNQGGWSPSGSNGQPVQAAYNTWDRPSYGPSGSAKAPANPPPNMATAAKKTASSSGATATAKAPAKKPADSAKTEGEIVRVGHTETKGSEAGAKTAKTVPAKSPPVNLGVLRLLNSKRVHFEYQVKDPSAVGVAGLELWGTTDTRTWKKYDIVTRTSNSVSVEVKEEGLYGFTLIARGKSELAKNQPPLPGEPPQLWVAVDTTKPIVNLLGAELNVLSQTPALVIRWNAKDRNLGPRPVTLLYAERPEGPWNPIAANVENSGRYEWVMPACVPNSVYVRVQAADVMGNLGMAQTTTLHIPGRAALSALRGEPALADPAHPGKMLPPAPYDTNLRPIAATVTNPTVSIVSVEGD
jgi:hypothetical protein